MDSITPQLPEPADHRLRTRRHALVGEITGQRAPRRRFPLKLVVPAAAAAAAAILVAVVLLTPSQPAFASWTPEPQVVSPEAEGAAVAECRKKISEMPTASRFPMPAGGAVTEQRGEITTVVLTGAGSFGLCLRVPGQTLTGIGDSVDPGSALLKVASMPGMRSGDEPARVLIARVSPAVGAVRVDTADDRHVGATVSQGWCVAWWPSGADVTRVAISDRAGSIIGTIEQPTVEPVPAPSTR